MNNISKITSSLRDSIANVFVWPGSRKIKIVLKSSHLIGKDLLNDYYSFFNNQFNNVANIEIRVSYNIDGLDLGKVMPIYWDNIILNVNKHYPSLLGWLVSCDYECNEKYLNLYVHDDTAYNILTDKKVGDYIENLIEEELHIKCIVYIGLLDRPEDNTVKKEHNDDIKLINDILLNKSKNYTPKSGNSNEVIAGKTIHAQPKQICEVTQDSGRIVLTGKIIEMEQKKLNNGKILNKFDITDYTDSISCKYFGLANENMNGLALGKWIIVKGDIQYDKYEKDICIVVYDINKTIHNERTDNSDKKRVELHLHTQMSAMDGVASAKNYIKTAHKWGQKAIAITDHGVVQSYPEAYNAAIEYGMKVIYGVEAYIVDDTVDIVPNADSTPLNDTFIVVDIETTGLSPKNDEIIEIGAVKVNNFKVIDKFDTFVKPVKSIPYNITKLTGINNDMVKDAPSSDIAIKMFKEFAADNVLVAHNAKFDISFLRKAAEKCDIDLTQVIVDTLALTRVLYPGLKNYKLNTITKYLNITLENHHRASDDAEATAYILIKCLQLMDENDIQTLIDINNRYTMGKNISNLYSYHCSILVKNQQGIEDLYKLISQSHLNYFYRKPKIPKSILYKYKENLLIGSACASGEIYKALLEGAGEKTISKLLNLYDYLEIMPVKNNSFLVDENKVKDVDELKNINKKIYKLGKKYNKLVVATSDAHFINPEDEIYRKIITSNRHNFDVKDSGLYLKTTEEMLNEFNYLGKDVMYEVVVENTNKIADMIEDGIKPIPDGTYPPVIEGSDKELVKKVYDRAIAIYGDPLPKIVRDRIKTELDSIVNNGYSVLYIIAEKLVNKSLSDGYLVGSRGSVGSSLVATLSGITEVNPLPPHYICPKCKYSEFPSFNGCDTGIDLPEKNCPVCGSKLDKTGFDIPFEVFLGFNGDKEPDIDLNFSGEYQPVAHKYTEELFGEGHVFRAGTIGALADKTAYGFVKGYMERNGITLKNAEIRRLVNNLTGIKRTTGQHPGGVMIVPKDKEIYQFTPIQHPADDKNSDIVTTHFDYHSISGRLLKLDILGHDDPTVLRMLKDLTGLDPKSIPLDDKKTMSLFSDISVLGLNSDDFHTSVGTIGLPEFGTKFVRQMLEETRPKTFFELIRISGLSHGTNVWINNAQDIIENGQATLKEVICTRDDIMLSLINAGVDPSTSFRIMESVRKGRGLKDADIETMKSQNVPNWFIESCKKIKYMFPKAHACAYVIMAFRIAYYKVHYPKEFYATYFTVRADDFDASIALNPEGDIKNTMAEISKNGNKATTKEKGLFTVLEVVLEMNKRGIKFLPVDLYKSDSTKFIIKEDGILLPFNSIPGIGITASKNIINARNEGEFISIEDFRIRTKVSKTVIELLESNGVFKDMQKTNQLSLFAGF